MTTWKKNSLSYQCIQLAPDYLINECDLYQVVIFFIFVNLVTFTTIKIR